MNTKAPKKSRRIGFVLILANLLLRSASFTSAPLNPDEATLGVMGRELGHGATLYTDIVDRKPPLGPYDYATILRTADELGMPGLLGIHIVMALGVGTVAYVLYLAGRKHFGHRQGIWAAALFSVASICHAPSEYLAANFELLALLPATLALWAFGSSFRELLLASMLIATAVLTKQTFVTLALLPIGGALFPQLFLPVRPEHDSKSGAASDGARDPAMEPGRFRSFVAVLLGGISGAVLVLGSLAWLAPSVGLGGLDLSGFVYWTLTGNRSYLDTTGARMFVLGRAAKMTLVFALCNLPSVLVITSAKAWARPALRWLWLSLAAGGLGVVMGMRFFGHYYLQLLPPLCLIAGVAAVSLSETRRAAPSRLGLGGLPAASALLAALFGVSFVIVTHLTTPKDLAPSVKRLSGVVTSHVRPDDRLFIWGHLPELYLASNRRPGSRFPHTDFLTGTSGGRPAGIFAGPMPETWAMLMSDLDKHRPSLIVDATRLPDRDYVVPPIETYPPLAKLLTDHYQPCCAKEAAVAVTLWRRVR